MRVVRCDPSFYVTRRITQKNKISFLRFYLFLLFLLKGYTFCVLMTLEMLESILLSLLK